MRAPKDGLPLVLYTGGLTSAVIMAAIFSGQGAMMLVMMGGPLVSLCAMFMAKEDDT